ncbi:MAG: 2Fe-2S iron-sulfur cluster-binding protein [Pseudomonadota bacterium]
MDDVVKATVRLFDPALDTAPSDHSFEVPYVEGMRVLDVLEAIQEDLGPSIAYRWYCGVKKCGQCAVKVNGKAELACWEPAEREMLIEPLDHFPVLRDLVIDRTPYEDGLSRLGLGLERRAPYAGFPEPLDSEVMADAAKMTECIECLICTSICPAYGEGFVGPAALVQLARLALDPRDEGTRGPTVTEVARIRDCISCHRCTEACPVGIPVLERAIQGLRARALEEGYRDVLPPSRPLSAGKPAT